MNGNAQVEEEGEIQSMSKCNFIAKILAPVFVGVMLCSTFAFAVSTDMSSNPFADVQENSPYLEGILYAVEHGITNGTAPAAFSPPQPARTRRFWRFFGGRRDVLKLKLKTRLRMFSRTPITIKRRFGPIRKGFSISPLLTRPRPVHALTL